MTLASGSAPPAGTFDCTTCGACCVNPLENERVGFRTWVEVDDEAPLLKRKDLVKKLVVIHQDGTRRMRLDGGGRCMALKGALGRKVSCGIYALRPHPCRRVQAGDPDCRKYRRERGIVDR